MYSFSLHSRKYAEETIFYFDEILGSIQFFGGLGNYTNPENVLVILSLNLSI